MLCGGYGFLSAPNRCIWRTAFTVCTTSCPENIRRKETLNLGCLYALSICSAAHFTRVSQELIVASPHTEIPKTKKMNKLDDAEEEHVWSEILVRVPPESVTQLKRVSRAWSHLIRIKQFNQSYIHRWTASSSASLQATDNFSPSLWLSFDFSGGVVHCRSLQLDSCFQRSQRRTSGGSSTARSFTILNSSCHGLLLFVIRPKNIFVCNPMTKSYRCLPPPENNSIIIKRGHSHWTIAYNPHTKRYVIVVVTKCSRRVLSSRLHKRFVHASRTEQIRTNLLEQGGFGYG